MVAEVAALLAEDLVILDAAARLSEGREPADLCRRVLAAG
ncbi:hypothetical protein EDD40_0863 [Saccharothrix texasensis]|uniref:Uncharacterized protein n=1 Tax=Saccharothrix texasensis TaxID=103734 RepID=A0A3N1GZ80_9PSEU|nr:hypothetical protein EDD40_0863 [Saccharothrix texasensis]